MLQRREYGLKSYVRFSLGYLQEKTHHHNEKTTTNALDHLQDENLHHADLKMTGETSVAF